MVKHTDASYTSQNSSPNKSQQTPTASCNMLVLFLASPGRFPARPPFPQIRPPVLLSKALSVTGKCVHSLLCLRQLSAEKAGAVFATTAESTLSPEMNQC